MHQFDSSKFSSQIKTHQLKICILNKASDILLKYSHIYINMNHIIAYLRDNKKWKWKSLSIAALLFYLYIQSEFDFYRVYENNPEQISRKGYLF